MGINAKEQVALLTDYEVSSAYSTAYYKLYNNIRFNWDSSQIKHYAILLATPALSAGYATAPANVAIAAAQNAIPTILVDADVQTGSLQQRFGIGEHTGLSNLLQDETITSYRVGPHLCKTFIPNLSLLCGGSATVQPLETSRLLAAKLKDVLASLRQFLEENEEGPGLIIFNSSPVLTGIDAALISSQVDQTLLLIATGHTKRIQVTRAQEQLERAHAKLAGIVMLNA